MITSPSNEKIKEAVRVRKRPDHYRNEAFFVEGTRVMEMSLMCSVSYKRVFYTSDFFLKKRGRELVSALKGRSIETVEVSHKVMEKLTDTETPQGIAGIASLRAYSLDDLTKERCSLIVACDRIGEPGNLGSIIRSSVAFGVGAVLLISGTCNPFSPKAVRASAGTIFSVPLIELDEAEFLKWIQERGLKLYVTDSSLGKEVHNVDFCVPCAVVFGEEAGGVGGLLRAKADLTVTIPIKNEGNSLNVAVAVAICLYEARRQFDY